MMNGTLLFKAAPLCLSLQTKQPSSVFIELFDLIKKVSLKQTSSLCVINDMSINSTVQEYGSGWLSSAVRLFIYFFIYWLEVIS